MVHPLPLPRACVAHTLAAAALVERVQASLAAVRAELAQPPAAAALHHMQLAETCPASQQFARDDLVKLGHPSSATSTTKERESESESK